MNDGFKQRLVGAVVLVSLALILWPVIFSEGINPAVDRRSQISAPPAFDKTPVARPLRPADIAPLVQPSPEPIADAAAEPAMAQPSAEPIEPAAAEPSSQTPQLDSQGLPESWVLQVASFSQQANADELTEALIKLGYKAYSRTVKTAEGPSTRVYVGPRFTKASFKKDQQAIDKAFSLKSMLVRFEQ
jgi:DedD protein